jgi:hypothetical protein
MERDMRGSYYGPAPQAVLGNVLLSEADGVVAALENLQEGQEFRRCFSLRNSPDHLALL